MFTWRHDLDLHPPPGRADRGRLVVSDDVIVESGTGIDGTDAPYEERWLRLPTLTELTAIATHEHGLAVRVGDHAGLILATHAAGTECARAWRYARGRWTETITLGTPRDTPVPARSRMAADSRLDRALSYSTMRGSATAWRMSTIALMITYTAPSSTVTPAIAGRSARLMLW